MAKISKTHHVTKKGRVKRNPKQDKVYRVYDLIPGNFGDYKEEIKLYSSFNPAKKELLKRVREAAKDDPMDYEEGFSIMLENIKTGDIAGYVLLDDPEEGMNGWVPTQFTIDSVK